jgi:hypothetical protein
MATKRKRVVLNIQQKLRIIERLETGETGSKLAAEFKVGTSTISDIKLAKTNLRQFAAILDLESVAVKRRTMKLCADPPLDKALHTWFQQQRAKGMPVSGPILQAKAL